MSTRYLPPQSPGRSDGFSRLTHKALEKYFIQPMDLSEPIEDIFGYTQVCSLNLDELEDMKHSKLNQPTRTPDGRVFPSYVVRLWSRASGRYLCILPLGSAVYARGVFGAEGHFRMLVKDRDVVSFQSKYDPNSHIMINGCVVSGHGRGGVESDFIMMQNEDGYCSFESLQNPGLYLGVRENGNIILPTLVDPASIHAQFILQKEALDIL